MSEFKAITTQEEFDKAIQDRLNRQKESLEKQYSDYEGLKARNTELETEIGTLKTALSETNEKIGSYDEEISKRDAQIKEYETTNMRMRIASQYGLSAELANRLVGEDEASMTEDAKKLAELVGHKEPTAPLKVVEPSLGDGKDGAYKNLLENLNLEGE